MGWRLYANFRPTSSITFNWQVYLPDLELDRQRSRTRAELGQHKARSRFSDPRRCSGVRTPASSPEIRNPFSNPFRNLK